ncbi:MAG: PepSY domain-containing protein, partial [Pseudoxanthomonas sp.]
WSSLRTPVRAAQELLWLAALVTVLVPVSHGLATGWWFWTSAAAGQWGLFCIDAGALAMGCGFSALARATTRRAVTGEPNSVWSPARTAP